MNRNQMIENHKRALENEKKEVMLRNKSRILFFIEFCKQRNIYLKDSDFDYRRGIGVLCFFQDIVEKLHPELVKDKEGLFDFNDLSIQFSKKRFYEGMLYDDNHIIFADSFFRRGYNSSANFTPRFIDHFWSQNFENNDVSISLDLNRVRIDTEGSMLIEADTWYGGKFTEEISKIKDGVTNLRPPVYLDDFELEFFYASAYALDIFWYTYDDIKVFQALEFKKSSVTIEMEGENYFPVRYIHAEFDTKTGTFRHFDGAVQFYSEEEYNNRRDNNFNEKAKGEYKVKSKSNKLFRINGVLAVNDWLKFTSHFFAKNPLILEYFDGEEPEDLKLSLEAIKKDRGII